MMQSVKVDDLDLDYTGNWQASGSCPGCSAVPNLEQMQFINDGTWHDAARQSDGAPVTMSYTFQGIGVMVYGITVNGTSERPIIKNVNLTFALDDVQQGGYEYTPDATVTDYQFNVPFFTKLGLNSGSHALTMTLQPKSFVLLDYLVYYTDETAATATDPSTIPVSFTQSSSGTFASTSDNINNVDRPPIKREGGLSTQTAVALAVLIPIVAGLAIVAIFFWFLRRRAARRQAHTQLPGAPPSVFYGGGSSRAPPTNAYSLAGAQPTAIQFGPFTPSDLLGASTYATTRNPFEPGSHVPSSVTGESPFHA